MKSGDSRNSFVFTPELDLYSPITKDLCRQLGISDRELLPQTVAEFQSPLVPIETAERLFQHHTERRKIALKLLESEFSKRYKSHEIRPNSDSPYAKSLTPNRRPVETDPDLMMDARSMQVQKLASRKHRAQLELKVAENREVLQLRTVEQIEKTLREKSERSVKVGEENKEKEEEMRMRFLRRRQRAQEILDKKRQDEQRRERQEALISPTPPPHFPLQPTRSSTSAPPKRQTSPNDLELDRKLAEFHLKMKRGEELSLQSRVSKSMRASHTRGKRLELEERRREREEQALQRTLALQRDIEKHAQLREEARLEELGRLNRKNEVAKEKTEKERVRQIREMAAKEARLKEREQQREEMLSRLSQQKDQQLAARSREVEQRFQAQKERYHLVQALQMQRNRTLLSELAGLGRQQDVSLEREAESFRKASEAERRRIEERTKARVEAAYRHLALSSRTAL